ncbi:MAG: tRNA 2-thiouridine(34) synthase MnmA [Campylobacterales bacterium]|nr:tRNA 2-thiouridine(34) synthase MnmA [Campylobacterales bacterium]
MSKKVLLGMSGGVDSTVSALLLKEQGFEVEGVYMKLHDNEAYHEKNFKNVKNVGKYLGIKTHLCDMRADFKKKVYDYFVQSYKDGLTPNPCIVCNREIKFNKMFDIVEKLGANFLAMGHYVRLNEGAIYKGIDASKDQSYFLARVKKESLQKILFPLGERYKSDIKKIAGDIPLLKDIAEQKESLEICFVENEYTDILSKHMNIDQEGDVIDIKGNVIGKHSGYMHYTIGKRRGFYVHGAHDPHYVVDINAKDNIITVGTHDALEANTIHIQTLNWLIEPPRERFSCEIKVRYQSKPVACNLHITNGGNATAYLKEGVFGVAKGQVAAFYEGERLLGGGVIF